MAYNVFFSVHLVRFGLHMAFWRRSYSLKRIFWCLDGGCSWMEMAYWGRLAIKIFLPWKGQKLPKILVKLSNFQKFAKFKFDQNWFFKVLTHNCRYSHEALCHERSWCPVVSVEISGKYLNPNRFYIKKCFLRIFTNFLAQNFGLIFPSKYEHIVTSFLEEHQL